MSRLIPISKRPVEQYSAFPKCTVAFVFMEYPHPQLPFADSDVEALREQGLTVVTIALRGRYFIDSDPVRGWAVLSGLFGGGACKVLRSVGWARLRTAFFSGDGLLDSLKTALLVPRAVAAILHLRAVNVTHLHLFWGHYPSMMGILWKSCDPNHTLTMSLGAYDLEKKLRVSAQAADIAEAVTTHSEFNRRRLASEWGLHESKIKTIYRGVNTELFKPQGPINLDPSKFLVISVGRLIRDKNIDATLSLFAELHKCKPEVRLSIAGRGPDLERLKKVTMASNLGGCTEFVGHLTHSGLKRLMQSAQLIFFTSLKRGEILPNAIKEAMACGVIPVVLRHPAIDELIDDGIDGFLFSGSDSLKALVQRINHADLVTMSRNARQKIERRFNRTQSAIQFAALLSAIEPSNNQMYSSEA